MRVLLILLATFLFLVEANAQDPKRNWDGEIEDVEIVIEQERQISLPKANRNFEKIPPRPSEPITPPIKYDFQSFNFAAPQVNSQIRPLKIKAESPSTLYGGFLKAGYGNYASPLLEGYITSRKDKEKLVGAHVYHQSSAKGPVDGRNSGSGNSTLSVFGKTFSESVAVSGNLDFENRSTHFYGYPEGADVNRSSIRQSYNLIKLNGNLSNTKNDAFAYTLGGTLSYLADKYDARETEVDLLFNTSYELNKDSKINIDAGYALIARKDKEIDAKPRSLFSVAPSYTFSPVEDLILKVGLSAAFENDTIDSKDLHIYPNFGLSYPISPSVDFVASLSGGMEKVSLQTLSYKNIWIDRGIEIYHANKYYELSAAINAKLGNKVAAHTGLSLASFKNMHFFINAIDDQSKFDVEYETGFFQRTNLFASLSYAQSERVKLGLRGDLYAYGTGEDVKEPFHLPKYSLNANASFNVVDKLLLDFSVLGQGGMKALQYNPVGAETLSSVVTLKGALDLNAKAEYLFSPGFSFFLQFNNITSNKYPLFLNYPVRGFQVLGGLTWSF